MLINESYPISGQMIMNSTLSPKKRSFFRKGRRNLPKNSAGELFSLVFVEIWSNLQEVMAKGVKTTFFTGLLCSIVKPLKFKGKLNFVKGQKMTILATNFALNIRLRGFGTCELMWKNFKV